MSTKASPNTPAPVSTAAAAATSAAAADDVTVPAAPTTTLTKRSAATTAAAADDVIAPAAPTTILTKRSAATTAAAADDVIVPAAPTTILTKRSAATAAAATATTSPAKMENYENASNVETPLFDLENDNNKPSSGARDGPSDLRGLNRLYVVTQSIGMLLLVLVFCWLEIFLDGFRFQDASNVFNYHPLFMVLGFILVYSNLISVYRVQRGLPKPKLKRQHAMRAIAQMLISGFGSMAAFYFHQEKGITHFYSLHSWLGLLTWLLFTGQFVIGLYVYLYPMAKHSTRQRLMPYHRFFGVAIFTLANITCLTGLNEKAIFSMPGTKNTPKYSDLPAGGVMVNIIGLVLIIYSTLTVFLATKSEYRRRVLPEEEVININLNE